MMLFINDTLSSQTERKGEGGKGRARRSQGPCKSFAQTRHACKEQGIYLEMVRGGWVEGRTDGGAATVVCCCIPDSRCVATRRPIFTTMTDLQKNKQTCTFDFLVLSRGNKNKRNGAGRATASASASCTRPNLLMVVAPHHAECRTYVHHEQAKPDTRENSPWLVRLRINTLSLANIVSETRATDSLRPSPMPSSSSNLFIRRSWS
ncbi:hypothetical protein EDB81DRAFT_178842 [Dactylonectria macrodidyma]|uniref:Uncharacterized protein n=1 Tax=Dactylonectria macrodidyma TaxID=307937 RepID=A0A9P9FQK8_9HYPO|nr:hypothetical protein EDB81DRAFT_178842 [Dactylonectria macrodidyma]